MSSTLGVTLLEVFSDTKSAVLLLTFAVIYPLDKVYVEPSSVTVTGGSPFFFWPLALETIIRKNEVNARK
jgi:hypothetical protein